MTRTVGKYQLIRKLAMGGMAEVHLAKAAGPHGFEKTLVVKCILPHLAQEPSFVEMFHSEARLAARLSHPHIVQIFDFGEVDGSYFLAMEYIDGPSLRTLIKRASAQGLTLPPAVCARFVSQACEGLAFAHDFVDGDTGEALGVIHRDVSPDNLLLTRQGAVKVVDFGIAKALGQGQQTCSGVVKGKLAYMPPEQLRGKPLDRRVDVYALGVVLYELLTFHKPHVAANEAALMHSVLFAAPVPAEHHRPELPESLRRILARAMAKEREQRYPDCHALQADLEDFILAEGRPVTTQQVAQLIQNIVPVAPSGSWPSLVPTRQAPATPGSTLLAVEPPVQRAASKSDPDTVLDAPCPEAEGRTQEDTVSINSMAAPRDPSHLSTTATRTHAPACPPPARVSHWRPSRWTQRALVRALLLLTGTGLVWEARGRMAPRVGRVMPAQSAPAQSAPAQSAPVPAAPDDSASHPTPPDDSPDDGDAVASAPTPETPEARPSMGRSGGKAEHAARTPKFRRRQAIATGHVELRSQPYAQVAVDGKHVGTTPFDKPLRLSVGNHTVELYSPTLSRTEIRHIEVVADQLTPLNVSFPREP